MNRPFAIAALLLSPLLVQAAEPLRIATDATYPPFEYVDTAGKVAGLRWILPTPSVRP